MPAGLASVVHQSQALFTLAFASLLLREPISRSQLLGLGMATSGLCLIGRNTGITALPLGALLITLAGAAFWGISNIVIRKAAADAVDRGVQLDMFSMIVWSSLIPPIPFVLLALTQDSAATIAHAVTSLSAMSLFAIFYLALGATLFGFGAWSSMISKYSAGQIAPLSLLVPVTGLLTASLVLHERLSTIQWAGCLAVVSGLLIATFISSACINPSSASAFLPYYLWLATAGKGNLNHEKIKPLQHRKVKLHPVSEPAKNGKP